MVWLPTQYLRTSGLMHINSADYQLRESEIGSDFYLEGHAETVAAQ